MSKRFKYKKAQVHFEWNESKDNEETTIKIVWEYITHDDKKERHTYNRTTAQVESFYIPFLRIVTGIDSMSNALLYVNDEYTKNLYLRMLEHGVDFFSFTGLKLDNDSWAIERG